MFGFIDSHLCPSRWPFATRLLRRNRRLTYNSVNMRSMEERSFTTGDGINLFYRYWPAVNGSPSGAVILFHRGHEHSGRVAHVVDEIDLPGFAMFAWDAYGHGRSTQERATNPSMGTLVKDVDEFVRHVSTAFGFPMEDIAIAGQSVGSVLAATWVHDYAPRIRCMSLASPAFKVKLYVPLARTALKLAHAMIGNFTVKSYVKARALTHDLDRIASFEA